jgi:NAD(P)-dependent dehydrogenase (short-subunit alcohol dehydrogenase family)
MTGAPPLAGKTVAIICQGSDADRALAIACAEAGARIALATVRPTQEQEFAVNSIANEAWAIGAEQFARVLDATDPVAVTAFADEVCDRFGRCHALIAAHRCPSTAPFDELSPTEWDDCLRLNLTAPFLAAQAFARVMERDGGGAILFIRAEEPGADAAYMAAQAGLEGLARAVRESAGARRVSAAVIDGTPAAVMAALGVSG